MFTNACESVHPTSRHSVFWADGRYFSRHNKEIVTSGDIIVKDHDIYNNYLANRIIYIVRDFRDVVRSYAVYMFNEMQRSANPATNQVFSSLANFISWCSVEDQFAAWDKQVQRACTLAEQMPHFHLLRYEELTGSGRIEALRTAFGLMGWKTTEDQVAAALQESDSTRDRLKAQVPEWSDIPQGIERPYFLGESVRQEFGEWWGDLTDQDRTAVSSITNSQASRALGY